MVLTTAGTRAEAERLADGLVTARLAACAQLLEIRSVYRWRGDLHREPETLLLLKTRTALYPRVEAWIRAHHSYEVPEIVRLPIAGGALPYLEWLAENTLGN